MKKLEEIAKRLRSFKDELLKACGEMHKDESKNLKIEAALERQGKKTTIPHEVHAALGEWWKNNKASALTPEQHERLKSIKDVKQRRAGMRVVKDEGEEDLDKSNYGPKGMGLYNPRDNIQRKATRTGEEVESVGPNKGVRRYTTLGSSMSAAHEAAEAKRQNAKSKQSLRTMKDMSPEEIQAIKDRYENKKASEDKEAYEVIKYEANGQWRIEKAEKLAKPAPKGVSEEKYDRCVDEVKRQKGDKNAYAICSASLGKGEDEPHKDDPKHEEKEQKKAKAIKEKAEEILDMHKGK